MNNVTAAVELILALAGGIGIIGGASAIIWRWIRPAIKLGRRMETLETHSETDYKRLDRIEHLIGDIGTAELALLSHAEYGNQSGELRQARERLQEALIHRYQKKD